MLMDKRRNWWNEAMRQQRAYEAWVNRMEISLAFKVARSKNRIIGEIADYYELFPQVNYSSFQAKHTEEIRAILQDAYAVAIKRSGKQAMKEIRSLAEKADDESFFLQLIRQWVDINALEHASMIARTTMDDVRAAITKGVALGQGIQPVARQIRLVTKLSPWRSAAVARTEIHNASLFAQESVGKQAERDYNIRLMKFWRPTLDARTRDAHAAMVRHPGVEMDQRFNVGGEMMSRPGDPAGSAKNVVNCRCTLIMRELEIDME